MDFGIVLQGAVAVPIANVPMGARCEEAFEC
jgi:hypothetical protein